MQKDHARALLVCSTLVAGCSGNVATDPEMCPADDRVLDKSWFVGELDTTDDEPAVTATLSVVKVEPQGPEQPEFLGASATFDVRFEIGEDGLSVRQTGNDEPLAAFAIVKHQEGSCYRPCEELECEFEPERLPWPERARFVVDWSRSVVHGYRFDAASAAGHEDAADYESLLLLPSEATFRLALAEGYLAVTTAVYVWWKPLADGTPGCVFDFPNLEPGSECPSVIVHVLHEFRREPP